MNQKDSKLSHTTTCRDQTSSKVLSEEAIEKAEGIFKSGFDAMRLAVNRRVVADMPLLFLVYMIDGGMRIAVDYAALVALEGNALSDYIERSFDVLWSGIER